MAKNNCFQGLEEDEVPIERVSPRVHCIYRIGRNAHRLFLVIINGVKNTGKNLPSLRQVYTMEQLLLSIIRSILLRFLRMHLPLLSFSSSLSFFFFFSFALSSTVGVVVVVVVVIASGQATSFLLRSSCTLLLLLLDSFLPCSSLFITPLVRTCHFFPFERPGSRLRLIIPRAAEAVPLGCSRCLSSLSFHPAPPSAFINIHRRLIDGYDFLALPSGFSRPSGL